jgi:7,8-dihydropterin-6-yl-methyl-4-(beta-D-ribofuranosyl)aminobenzene 5'-phosphate synthase
MDTMVPFEAPVVDDLTIRVMVDSRYERFLPKAMHSLVQIEQVTGGTLVQDDHYTEAERGGRLVRDQHEDEHATCYIVKGRGLVVISSCGHTGMINTVRSAMAAANVDRVHAVVGGFHLGMAPLPYLQSTLKEMEAINPDVIVPMHCTGTAFIEMLRERMPEKLVYSNVGSRFTFGA